jgi:hypothetical protein
VQPCRSFNQALTVVEPGGEIVVQDSGGYSTGFTITQSVTIDAAGFNASVISTSAAALCTTNAGPGDRVVLRGISFHGASVGANAIDVTQVGSLYVEHCSIAEFKGAGVLVENGGKLFVTGTDVRACFVGLDCETQGTTPIELVAHDSRFTESGNAGVLLNTNGTGPVTGLLNGCTASLGPSAFGFEATSKSAGNIDLTLTDCRAMGNDIGISIVATGTGSGTLRMAHCVVTKNDIGLASFHAALLGTSPGTNLISGNGNNGVTTGSAGLN